MLHIDLKYLHQVSNKLELFKQRDTYVFNFRCPICNDSYTNKNKTRGYIYKNGDKLSFTCHNCNTPIGFLGLIKFLDLVAYSEFIRESYLEREPRSKRVSTPKVIAPKEIERQILPFRKLSELPTNHKAVTWFNSRKIPSKFLNEFYFVEHFDEVQVLNEVCKKKAHGKEPRVIIPYWNMNNELLAIACREIENHTSKKYINIKFMESDMIFGLERIDFTKKIYVTEGPLDSLFVDNCIAVGNASLGRVAKLGIPCEEFVLIYDDQPKHREVVESMGRSIDKGFNIVIWNSDTINKLDINDMVINGKDVMKIIKKRTFVGLMAKLEFNLWKKI